MSIDPSNILGSSFLWWPPTLIFILWTLSSPIILISCYLNFMHITLWPPTGLFLVFFFVTRHPCSLILPPPPRDLQNILSFLSLFLNILVFFSYLAHIHNQSLESFLEYIPRSCVLFSLYHLLGEITILAKSTFSHSLFGSVQVNVAGEPNLTTLTGVPSNSWPSTPIVPSCCLTMFPSSISHFPILLGDVTLLLSPNTLNICFPFSLEQLTWFPILKTKTKKPLMQTGELP